MGPSTSRRPSQVFSGTERWCRGVILVSFTYTAVLNDEQMSNLYDHFPSFSLRNDLNNEQQGPGLSNPSSLKLLFITCLIQPLGVKVGGLLSVD